MAKLWIVGEKPVENRCAWQVMLLTYDLINESGKRFVIAHLLRETGCFCPIYCYSKITSITNGQCFGIECFGLDI